MIEVAIALCGVAGGFVLGCVAMAARWEKARAVLEEKVRRRDRALTQQGVHLGAVFGDYVVLKKKWDRAHERKRDAHGRYAKP